MNTQKMITGLLQTSVMTHQNSFARRKDRGKKRDGAIERGMGRKKEREEGEEGEANKILLTFLNLETDEKEDKETTQIDLSPFFHSKGTNKQTKRKKRGKKEKFREEKTES